MASFSDVRPCVTMVPGSAITACKSGNGLGVVVITARGFRPAPETERNLIPEALRIRKLRKFVEAVLGHVDGSPAAAPPGQATMTFDARRTLRPRVTRESTNRITPSMRRRYRGGGFRVARAVEADWLA